MVLDEMGANLGWKIVQEGQGSEPGIFGWLL